MSFQKKNRFKPLYKQFKKLYVNVQNRQKILNFKKQKWIKIKKNIRYVSRPYIKFRPRIQTQYTASQYPDKWNSYKEGNYRNILQSYKRFKLFYGNFTKKKFKKFIAQALDKKSSKRNLISTFLKLFESRLDTILYRAKFSRSIREARQFIVHGKILVNNKKVRSQSYALKAGDLISIDYKCRVPVQISIANTKIWPIPPMHLVINYKTLQIIMLGIFNKTNVSKSFHFHLNLENILIDYRRI